MRVVPLVLALVLATSVCAADLLTVAPGGGFADGSATIGDVSAGGRYATFTSANRVLVGDGAGTFGVYLRDRLLRTTRRLTQQPPSSVVWYGQSSFAGSADVIAAIGAVPGDAATAHALLVAADGTILDAVDRTPTGALADGPAHVIDVDDSARFVAFLSDADDLVPGLVAGAGARENVFWTDRATGVVRCLTAPDGRLDGGSSGLSGMSASGRWVAIWSAKPLVPSRASSAYGGVYLANAVTGSMRRVDVGVGGVPADGYAGDAQLSRDGRYVAFVSTASNLIAGESLPPMSQAYVFDRLASPWAPAIERVSVTPDGAPSNGFVSTVSISGDGRYVAFTSTADNIVGPSAFPGAHRIYVRDRVLGITLRVAATAESAEASDIRLSRDGAAIGWTAWHSLPRTGGTVDAFAAATPRLIWWWPLPWWWTLLPRGVG